MTTISYDQFSAVDIRVALVKHAEIVEGTDRLLKLTLDVGTEENGGLGERTIVSGIRQWYQPEQLIGTQIVYLANLEPRTIRGIESQGMILAAGSDAVALLRPDHALTAGSRVR